MIISNWIIALATVVTACAIACPILLASLKVEKAKLEIMEYLQQQKNKNDYVEISSVAYTLHCERKTIEKASMILARKNKIEMNSKGIKLKADM